jgi:hypothetical protein
MNPHDLTQLLIGVVIALELYHVKNHSAITAELAQLKTQVRALWRSFEQQR